jgi:hypothetical protein
MGEFRRLYEHAGTRGKRSLIPSQDRRRYPRKKCFIEVEYSALGHRYLGSLLDISEGGAYVRSNMAKRFSPGEVVFLILPLKILGSQLRGQIAWVRPHAMGVEFQIRELTPVRGNSLTAEKGSKGMAKIKNRKIRWEPSATADVRYRLYWSIGGGVDYHSEHAELGNVTEVNIPADIPLFPLISGNFELGISAISEAGNESDLTKATVRVDFAVPDAPKNLMVEDC